MIGAAAELVFGRIPVEVGETVASQSDLCGKGAS